MYLEDTPGQIISDVIVRSLGVSDLNILFHPSDPAGVD